jgi:2-polyprenyl-3-methyl-5-hydroxy-6-metoxy-1,4-benzoquinol methylase
VIQKIRNNLYILKESLKSLFTYPKMSVENVDYDAYWRDKRGKEMGALSGWQKERAEYVVKTIQSFSGDSYTVLDVGCGGGSILRHIKSKSGNVSRMIGFDVSSFALDRAEEFGVETHLIDITSLEEDSIPEVDFAFALEILEHIPDSEKMLKDLFTHSREGVFFSFPNTGFIAHRLRLLFGKFPLQWRLSPGEHVRFWTYADLSWWLKSLGYRNARINTYKGVPLLKYVWPSLFAAAFIVFIPKEIK